MDFCRRLNQLMFIICRLAEERVPLNDRENNGRRKLLWIEGVSKNSRILRKKGRGGMPHRPDSDLGKNRPIFLSGSGQKCLLA
jgi:hypothetical protein